MGLSCKERINPTHPSDWIEIRQRIPPYEARGFKLEWIDTAGQRLLLSAQSVARLKRGDTTVWLMENDIRAVHLSTTGETLETLRSQRAEVYPDKRRFIAEREVLLTTAESLRLETDFLYWEQERSLITAPGWVRLQTPKELLRGEGLEYHTQHRTYRLRRTSGTVQSPIP
ncbi:MAG: hypothetical protein N3E49_00880 [Bacteroidia bacterium]|nr:hypothetical protein [Bacteroidia bacterium]